MSLRSAAVCAALAILVACGSAPPAHAQGTLQGWVMNGGYQAYPFSPQKFMRSFGGALVEVRQTGTTNKLSIYKDVGLTQPLSNPFTAGANGWYKFYVVADQVDLFVQASGISPYTQTYMTVPDVTASYITLAGADARYLKLDATNSPLTGKLTISAAGLDATGGVINTTSQLNVSSAAAGDTVTIINSAASANALDVTNSNASNPFPAMSVNGSGGGAVIFRDYGAGNVFGATIVDAPLTSGNAGGLSITACNFAPAGCAPGSTNVTGQANGLDIVQAGAVAGGFGLRSSSYRDTSAIFQSLDSANASPTVSIQESASVSQPANTSLLEFKDETGAVVAKVDTEGDTSVNSLSVGGGLKFNVGGNQAAFNQPGILLSGTASAYAGVTIGNSVTGVALGQDTGGNLSGVIAPKNNPFDATGLDFYYQDGAVFQYHRGFSLLGDGTLQALGALSSATLSVGTTHVIADATKVAINYTGTNLPTVAPESLTAQSIVSIGATQAGKDNGLLLGYNHASGANQAGVIAPLRNENGFSGAIDIYGSSGGSYHKGMTIEGDGSSTVTKVNQYGFPARPCGANGCIHPVRGMLTYSAQTASIGSTKVIDGATPVGAVGGTYRVCWVQTITVPATVSSSLLTTISWNSGAAKSSTYWVDPAAGTTGTTADTSNAVGSGRQNCFMVYSAPSTGIAVSTTYASVGAQAMNYNLTVSAEKLAD